jgi:hypothetical protein
VLIPPRLTRRPQVPIARRGRQKNSRGCTGLFWPTEKKEISGLKMNLHNYFKTLAPVNLGARNIVPSSMCK